MMNASVASVRETGSGRGEKESEVWERRRLSCLFEDKSERQRTEEVCICKGAHGQAGWRVHTTHSYARTRKHTHPHTLTHYLASHTICPAARW